MKLRPASSPPARVAPTIGPMSVDEVKAELRKLPDDALVRLVHPDHGTTDTSARTARLLANQGWTLPDGDVDVPGTTTSSTDGTESSTDESQED